MAKHTAATPVSSSAPSGPSVTPAEPSNIEPVRTADLADKWQAMLALLADQGPALSGLLQHGQFIGIEDGRAVIRYAPQHETFVKLLDRNGKKDLVRDAISKVMERSIGIKFEVGEAAAPVAVPVNNPASKPVPAAPTRPVETQRRPAPSPPPAPAELNNTIRLTEEMRAEMYKTDSLIRAVVDTLGGSIIRLEERE